MTVNVTHSGLFTHSGSLTHSQAHSLTRVLAALPLVAAPGQWALCKLCINDTVSLLHLVRWYSFEFLAPLKVSYCEVVP